VTDDPESAPANHSALAAFDDGVLPDAAALLAELAVRELDRAEPAKSTEDSGDSGDAESVAVTA
jgi:hypothetical protein